MVNLRYIDEILPAFDNEQDSLIFFFFFEFLNKRHPDIKFTIERQNTMICNHSSLIFNKSAANVHDRC